jgi:hypothetical protein
MARRMLMRLFQTAGAGEEPWMRRMMRRGPL